MGDAADADVSVTEAGAVDGPVRCAYCGRRFATPRLRSIHHGSDHTDEVSEVEWAAVVAAREAEAEELRRLRIRMLIALVACYFGFLLLYAVV